MNKKIIALIASLALFVIFSPYIFAATESVSGTVISIDSNYPITGSNDLVISLVNCTDESQIFNSSLIDINGDFSVDYNTSWGEYLINISNSYDYENQQFRNNSLCFNSGLSKTLKLYKTDYASMNITLKDHSNGRPIPNAIIRILKPDFEYTEVNQSDTQINNYRCINNVCKTDIFGNILMIVPSNLLYIITVEPPEYSALNSSNIPYTPTENKGKNTDYNYWLNGTSIISGQVFDYYNNQAIENAYVEIYKHNTNKNLSIDEIYNYSTTTDASGHYTIYIPPSLVDADTKRYNIKASHPDWTSGKNKSHLQAGWGSARSNIIVNLNGLLKVNGSIYDCNNEDSEISLDINITDKTNNNFNYTTHTDNGNFSIYVRNNSQGYAGYEINIGGTDYNVKTITSSPLDISECIDGSLEITGTIKDIQNLWPINNSNITIHPSNDKINDYTTNSDENGEFSINIQDNPAYTLTIENNGYNTASFPQNTNGQFGNMLVYGAKPITGFVEDKETTKRDAGARLNNTKISLKNTTLDTIYEVYSDSNGKYTLNIQSNKNYTMVFEQNRYNDTTITLNSNIDPNETTYLTGSTHIDGYVLDQSIYAVNKNITKNSIIKFFDGNDNNYTLIPNTGKYSIDLAINDYNLTVEHLGYNLSKYTGFSSGTDEYSKELLLQGSFLFNVSTLDDFSKMPINNVNGRLFENSPKKDLLYHQMLSSNGRISTYVDSTKQYEIVLYNNKYKPVNKVIPLYTIWLQSAYSLEAIYETTILDNANNQPIPNALVQAYHYYNETDFSYTLNKTKIDVTVNCSDAYLNNINVSIINDASTYTDSLNTINGIASFDKVPKDNYTITANGTNVGCNINTKDLEINLGGITYNTNIALNKTILLVNVTNPAMAIIFPANVSYKNITGPKILLTKNISNLYYYEDYVPLGTYNITANESNYVENITLCSIALAGEINYCNITVQPVQGNLSVYVNDTTGTPINGAIVNITNGITSYEITTSAAGWSNFTDIQSQWNITVNATDQGLIIKTKNNVFVTPKTEEINYETLQYTNITINVSDNLGPIINANVSLTNSTDGTIMKDYLGNNMIALTNAEGLVNFTRYNQSIYNITINESSHTFYNQTHTLSLTGIEYKEINLENTAVLVNVNDTYGTPIENIYISLNKTDGLANFTNFTDINGKFLFENETFPTGQYNLTVNGTDLGYNYTTQIIDVTLGTKKTENIILEEYRLNIFVNGSYDNLPITNVNVTINTTPLTTINTSSLGNATFRYLANETYNVTINGTLVGFNYTNYTITVNGDTTLEIILEENTFNISVIDEEGNAASDGINVTLWKTYATEIYTNATGSPLTALTTSGSGGNNITFRKMRYEPSEITITMFANGSQKGYGNNQTDYTLNAGFNGPNTTTLNITQILVNVTDSLSVGIFNANVTLLNLTGQTVNDGDGNSIDKKTNANGLVNLTRMAPGTYNISIAKNVSGTIEYNSTLITIFAGNHSYEQLDPNQSIISSLDGTYYTDVLANDFYNLTLNITDNNIAINNVTVKIFAAGHLNDNDYLFNNNEETDNQTTDSNGMITISDIKSGSWDILLDGESTGYAKINTSILFGKFVMSEDVTDANGFVSLPVDGRVLNTVEGNGYYIKITIAGYNTYDSYYEETTAYTGTYYDNNSFSQETYPGLIIPHSTTVNLNGIITIIGNIIDKFVSNPLPEFQNLQNVVVKFIHSGITRYTTTTDIDGNYAINVSPIAKGTIELNPITEYQLDISKEGYINKTMFEPMVASKETRIVNINLTGNSIVNGTLYTSTGIRINNVNVEYTDATLNSEIYTTQSNEQGIYTFNVPPSHTPYKLIFSANSEHPGILPYTTQNYTKLHNNEIYYLLSGTEKIMYIYVIDEDNIEIENAEVTILQIDTTQEIKTNTTYTNQYGKIDVIKGTYFSGNNYNITAKADTQGYGKITQTIGLTASYTDVTIILNSTKINITAQNNHGGEIYNTTVVMTGPNGYSNTTDLTDNTILYKKMIPGTYTINFESIYFKGAPITTVINDSNVGQITYKTQTLNESKISLKLINETSNALENISINIIGQTKTYTNDTDTNGWFNQTKITEGIYTINFTNTTQFTGAGYVVPENITIYQTLGNTTSIEVTIKKYIVNINISAYNLEDLYNSSKLPITDDTLTISLTNNTGITSNKTGQLNTKQTSDGTTFFTDLYDGKYQINASATNYTSDNLTIFNTTNINFNPEQNIFLKQKDMAYINLTVLTGTTGLSSASAKLYWNQTTLLETKITNMNGFAIIPVNATRYNKTLHLEIEKSGYITKTTVNFNITIGEIYDNTTVLATPTIITNNNGGSGGSSGGFAGSTTDTNETENNTENNKTPTENKIDRKYTFDTTTNEIKENILNENALYTLLEQYFGTLTEDDINTIAENTEKYSKYIEITRDIIIDENDKATIGITTHYTGSDILENVIIYNKLPQDILTIKDITFTDTTAQIIIDEKTNSYIIVYPKLATETYFRIEYNTNKPLVISDIFAFSKPIVLVTNLETEKDKTNNLNLDNSDDTKDKKSILSYWWILIIAALAIGTGIVVTIKKNQLNNTNHSFKPIETTKPINPSHNPQTNIPYSFEREKKHMTTLPKQVASTIRKVEDEISKDITKVAQNEVAYLAKTLEKDKFIVD